MTYGIRTLVSTLSLALAASVAAQDHYWWADNVGWDGDTHWSSYIISSPRFMGPNALPIPSLSDGAIPDKHSLSLTLSTHHTTGDFTTNPTIYANYVLVKGIIAFDLNWVPIEYFEMSHQIKTQRNTFHTFYDIQHAIGDVYLNTNVKLIDKVRFQSALRIGYKFATSSRQGLARFTDAPGYYFDASSGFTITHLPSLTIRLSAMAGLYVWQTNLDDRFQNDAFLGGLGVKSEWKNWHFSQEIRGYFGYLDNGDKPLVWQSALEKEIRSLILIARFKKGFSDLLYHSFEIGLSYQFSTL